MLPEGQTLLVPTFVVGEGLSQTGLSGALSVRSGINGYGATTDAINLIPTTGPR